MLIGYMRVSKADGSQVLDLQRDALIAAGYTEYKAITTKQADGYYGWEDAAPFDKVIVTCGVDISRRRCSSSSSLAGSWSSRSGHPARNTF